ncbi:rhodanese-like domain-containing protein [Halomicrococcus sp. NG-SE-24]|uniref:rhodanese-like domain-containing protein n=1 Tax=Halomicrococcus sp. NG-SE-24 TaxID=3436928 RepID=UPI003D98C7F1
MNTDDGSESGRTRRTVTGRRRDGLVLDVRHREDYDDWHIKGSINVDVSDDELSEPGPDRCAAE